MGQKLFIPVKEASWNMHHFFNSINFNFFKRGSKGEVVVMCNKVKNKFVSWCLVA